MQFIEHLEDFPSTKQPLVLTIGTFDGMHRGHQALLREVKQIAGSEGQTAVITFRNHPSDVLRPQNPTPLLCTMAHKLRLIESLGIDFLLLLTFTRYLANHSAASFIEHIRQFIPFSHLVLGHDATLGRDRLGHRATIIELGEQWGFSVYYIDEYRFEGHPISSTQIRDTLQQGNLERVEQLLARPYSIHSTIEWKTEQTLHLDVKGLCLPPQGKYPVKVKVGSHQWPGTAQLNDDPTCIAVHYSAQSPLLEGDDKPSISEVIF